MVYSRRRIIHFEFSSTRVGVASRGSGSPRRGATRPTQNGLILVPYYSYQFTAPNCGAGTGGVQLVEYADDGLRLRGAAAAT
jgi:hypothetical protein